MVGPSTEETQEIIYRSISKAIGRRNGMSTQELLDIANDPKNYRKKMKDYLISWT